MNKKISFSLIGVLIILFVSFWIFKNPSTSTHSLAHTPVATNQPTKFSYVCPANTSAFDALQKSAQSVKYQTSSYGKLVTEINGVAQHNGKYWIYSVNGKEATVGAEAYQCQGNEKIDWQLK